MSSTSLRRTQHDEARGARVVGAPRRIEAQGRADAVGDRAGDAGERHRVLAPEVAGLLAAGDVHRAPAAPAADEGGPQLEGDPRRDEQLAVARAALGAAARRVAEDADGRAPGGEAGEGVDVLAQVLAGDDQGARGGGRLGA